MTVLFETKTDFHDVKVIEENSIRKLIFGNGFCSEQSAINLLEPHKHVFDYTLLAMHTLLFKPHPSSILVIGLGGGIMPMEMEKYASNSIIDVIELDPAIKSIAENYFFFKESEKVKVYIGDAFYIVKKLPRKYDIIIIDAFFSNYIPFHLMSLEFFKSINKIAKKSSVVASNISSVHPSFFSQVNTIRSVFGDELYELKGPTNSFTNMLYANKQKPKIINMTKPLCHFLCMQPQKTIITEEIKNAPIFSLKSYENV